MNNQIVNYIPSTISSCFSTIYTTMCNIEPTSTNIVIAGISISIVTIILSRFLFKRCSNENVNHSVLNTLENIKKEEIKITLKYLKNNIIPESIQAKEKVVHEQLLNDLGENIYDLLDHILLDAEYQLRLAETYERILMNNDTVIVKILEKKFKNEIVPNILEFLIHLLRANTDLKNINFLMAKANIKFFNSELEKFNGNHLAAEEAWYLANQENIIFNLKSKKFQKKCLEHDNNENLAELKLSELLKNFSAADGVNLKRNLVEILASISNSADSIKEKLCEEAISYLYPDPEADDMHNFDTIKAVEDCKFNARIYFDTVYDLYTTNAVWDIKDIILNLNIT